MRRLGVGLLGLLAGLLAALVVQDLLFPVLDDGRLALSLPLAVLIGSLMPALAAVGVVVALAIDRWATKRRSPEEL